MIVVRSWLDVCVREVRMDLKVGAAVRVEAVRLHGTQRCICWPPTTALSKLGSPRQKHNEVSVRDERDRRH
eukprot:1489051-Rhodomonas_salina.8